MADYRISFQLYGARKFPPIDKHLEVLAGIGYDAVEPYGGAYEADPRGLRAKCDTLGLKMPTCHVPLAELDGDRAKLIDTAAILGLEAVIVPSVPPDQRSADAEGWQALAARLAEHAAALKGRPGSPSPGTTTRSNSPSSPTARARSTTSSRPST